MGWIIDLSKDGPLSTDVRERLIDAEKKYSVLEQQNEYLQTILDQTTKEIGRLSEIINVFQKNQPVKKYDAITEKVLKLFFSEGRGLSVHEVAVSLSMDIRTAQYHFDLLSEDNLIIQTASADISPLTGKSTPARYELTPLDRKYVIGKILGFTTK